MRKKRAFALPEVLTAMIIIGLIAAVCSAAIKLFNPVQKGFDVQSTKVSDGLEQVFNLVLSKYSHDYSLLNLKYKNEEFSITDAGALPKFAKMFKDSLNTIDIDDTNKTQEYYSNPILKYDKTSTGFILKEKFSNFIKMQDGTILGFRLYYSCSADETTVNLPKEKEIKTVNNICGSIFFDVNNYNGPNKLGSDQYIVPFGSLGIE